jgi:1,4-alpha-glucan branching enzyme
MILVDKNNYGIAMPIFINKRERRKEMSLSLSDFIYHFHNGSSTHAFEHMGCHPESRNGTDGFVFRVWAPNAQKVSVVGDFNFWNGEDLPMEKISGGVWEAWTANAQVGQAYKFLVVGANGQAVHKVDPYAYRTQLVPDTSSVIWQQNNYTWNDKAWFTRNGKKDALKSPINIYEFHMGSWKRKEDGSRYTYAEIAPLLAEYVKDMGYTHVEVMPLAAHPFDPSWGYQVTNYYAPTARYGNPDELKVFVDTLHQAGIGVLLDWVPAHFPKDLYGLYEFDGTCCYELSDPMMNEHPDWTTRIFDFGRPEVKSFLISCAVYWLKEFHFDGLRVDAVSSMVYLDYSRANYRPNKYGGRENLEGIEFLRQVNTACFAVRKGIIMAAEESHAFPMVTGPAYDGGLGFLFKWNMGWMNDTLKYMKQDPVYRKYNHDRMTFPMAYAFSENFILPLSHDEVVHGKLSLINKMPGDYFWQFANLRLLRGYQMTAPGKKLSFMGNEFGQFIEWNFKQGLDWLLLDYDMHRKMLQYTKDLNRFYLDNPCLWIEDGSWDGYQWVQPDDQDNSIFAWRRIDPRTKRELLIVLNMTPVDRFDYTLGVPRAGVYEPIFSSDDMKYGGTGTFLTESVAEKGDFREYKYRAKFHIPPMSLTIFRKKPAPKKAK